MSSTATLSTHPCYSEKAHQFFSRVHLAVAPKCNLQCNYCNRKFDCVNESRPGVTSKILTPEEAYQRIIYVASKRKDLSVVGIAGPGDALANPEQTFQTYKMINDKFKDLTFCLSTNGLEVINYIDQIIEMNIHHVTVTINTTDIDTAKETYARVKIDGKWRNDDNAYKEFLYRQQTAIKELKRAGILVKANTILMPEINDKEIPSLSKRLSLMGVATHNVMPLIAKEEHGTRFGKEHRPTPTDADLEEMRKQCGIEKQMTHCRQCRADAMGRLGEEFKIDEEISNSTDWIEPDFGLKKREEWRQHVGHMLTQQAVEKIEINLGTGSPKIAVCTNGSGFADQSFCQTKELHIYEAVDGKAKLINIRRLEETDKQLRGEEIMKRLVDCDAVMSHQIGYAAFKRLEAKEIAPISDLSAMPVEEAVMIAIERLAAQRKKENKPAASFCADFK